MTVHIVSFLDIFESKYYSTDSVICLRNRSICLRNRSM